jgi:hypothetical protein
MKISEVIRCVYMLKQQPAPKFKQKDYINYILNTYDCTPYVALKVASYFNFIYKALKYKQLKQKQYERTISTTSISTNGGTRQFG